MMQMTIIEKIALHPLTVLISMAGGIVIGLIFPEFSSETQPIGDIFLLLLKMCVLPILITSIISSFGLLIQSKEKNLRLMPLVLIFLGTFIIIAFLSLGLSILIGPGRNLSQSIKESLGLIILNNESYVQNTDHISLGNGLLNIVSTLVPENFFESLGQGNSLQILFFSIIVGIVAGTIPKTQGDRVIKLCQALFQIFIEIIHKTMYILPLGLLFMMAYQMSITGIEVLLAMLKYILLIFGVSLSIIIINNCIISAVTGMNFFRTIVNLKDPLVVSFGTRSTFASMPVSIRACTEKLKLNPKIVHLIIPIGAILARFSIVLLYVTAVIFTAQLYEIDLSLIQYLTALSLSILVAIAGAGTPGVVAISMISIIFIPLQIPYSAIIVLLLAIISIIDPIMTMANVHTNCMVTTLIARGKK